ncbi:MAG: hypothetical protein AABX05_02385, partial [Nanoarchaeota archaeon]
MVWMNKIIFLMLISVILLAIPVTAAETAAVESDCVYYFFGKECKDCTAVDTAVYSLEHKYEHLQIEKYEVYHNFQNFELLQQYYDAYGIEKNSRSIPVVFMKNTYLIGSKAITSLLEESIKDNDDPNCPPLTAAQGTVGISGQGESPNILSTLTFSLITGDALSNMFAPGVLALLLIFLAILPITKTKEDLIKVSVYFMAGIYIAYVLFGLGSLS